MGRVAFIAVFTAVAAACAPTDGARPAQAGASSGGQCFSVRAVNNFRPAGRDAVDVEISRNRVYRLSLSAGCFDVNWADRVALRSRSGGSFICSAGDAELIVPSVSGAPDRCLVTGIRQLSAAEIAARRRN